MENSGHERRRDPVKTRARILDAAGATFAERGYSQAGIREIAQRAGVTSPMLLHYFGSKIGLFEAALTAAMADRAIYAIPRDGFGERMMELLADPANEIRAPTLIALATGDAEARDVAARVAAEQGVAPMAEWLGPPDAHARAAQITMLTIGYTLFTRQIRLLRGEPWALQSMRAWTAVAIQRIVDG